MDEVERIRGEYARREKEFPPGFYASAGDTLLYRTRCGAVLNLLKSNGMIPLAGKKILEVGCGEGAWFSSFKEWGAEESSLFGVDFIPEKISSIRRKFPSAKTEIGEASSLRWADHSFDIVLQSTLFSSVLSPELKRRIADEMIRVLKPGGKIIWYDFFCNNPWNPNVKGVGLSEIKDLFPESALKYSRITLAPPLARKLAGSFPSLCVFLEKLSIFNTHYLILIQPGAQVI